jgi:tungstate transport system substrate-binding protein
MRDDFVIIGPPADPAGIEGRGVEDALVAVENRQATFVSRGDTSGTHKKELAL